jgi:hypothetical protein
MPKIATKNKKTNLKVFQKNQKTPSFEHFILFFSNLKNNGQAPRGLTIFKS